MPNPEQSNSNTTGSMSGQTLGSGTTASNPFQELADMPNFEDHMVDMQSHEQTEDGNAIKATDENTPSSGEMITIPGKERLGGKDKTMSLDDYIYRQLEIHAGRGHEDEVANMTPEERFKHGSAIIARPREMEYLLEHGASADAIMERLTPEKAQDNLYFLLERGADPNFYISHFNAGSSQGFRDLIEHGGNIDTIAKVASPDAIIEGLDTLMEYDADIDINQTVTEANPDVVIKNLDELIGNGATINIDEVVSQASANTIVNNLDSLIHDYGANIDVNELVSRLRPEIVAEKLNSLIENGADIDMDILISRLDEDELTDPFIIKKLLRHGVDANRLIQAMSEGEYLSIVDVVERDRKIIGTLIDRGADANYLASQILASGGSRSLGKAQINILRKHGVDEGLLSKL